MRKQPVIYALVVLFVSILTVPTLRVLAVSASHESNAASCNPWTIISSPEGGAGNNELLGVAAISSTDAWAVGDYVPGTGAYQTLIEQWNGTTWTVVPSPNVGSLNNSLNAVTALSATNVWAVGEYNDAVTNAPKTLIEHWDGTSWSIVASPNSGTGPNNLLGVARVPGTKHIWAVGYVQDTVSAPQQSLIEYYNGKTWSIVSSPDLSPYDNVLNGVSASSAYNVWAVGYTDSANGYQTLAEQWNGTTWNIIPSPNPNPAPAFNTLQAVVTLSTSNAWAAGYTNTGTTQTLIEHWDGTGWSIVSSPSPGTNNNELFGVASVSATNVWAVGRFVDTDSQYYQTLIEQWNGTSWSLIASPNILSATNYLYGVARVPGTKQVWAVGLSAASDSFSQTLIERYC